MRFISALEYLTVFGISLLFFKTFEVRQKRFINVKLLSKRGLILIIAILVPILFAAVRADTVGVDTGVYANTILQRAAHCSSIGEVADKLDSSAEFIFTIIYYILSRFTTETGVLLFVFQALTIIPIVGVAVILRDELSITTVMLVYFFLYYNESFNAMRQCCACSFILLGYAFYIKKGKRYKSNILISFIIACGLHKSALLGIVFLFCLHLLVINKFNKYFRFICYALVVLVPTVASIVALKLQEKGFLSDRYSYYVDMFINGTIDKSKFSNPFAMYNIIFVVVKALLVISVFIFQNSKNKSDRIDNVIGELTQFVTIAFLIFVVFLYSMKTTYSVRITMYQEYFYIILIPIILKKNHAKIYNKSKYVISIRSFMIYIALFVYWFIWVIYMGWTGSNIYNFRLW